jgi:TonB family protein
MRAASSGRFFARGATGVLAGRIGRAFFALLIATGVMSVMAWLRQLSGRILAGMFAEGSEALFRLRKKIVRNIVTSICLLSLPVFAQIPDTSNLPVRSLHTHNGEPFTRLASEVIPPRVFKGGDGISAPKPIFSPDPEYSEEALRAKYQGTVVLGMVVEIDGRPYGIKVLRSLKYGLDEKAIEAVKKWRFQPAMKDKTPVAVYVSVQVDFRFPRR